MGNHPALTTDNNFYKKLLNSFMGGSCVLELCPGLFTMILNLVLGALIPTISVSGHGNMVWPPTWQDAGGRIGVSPGMNCAAGYEYFFDGDQAKSGAICLWYTNYTMKEGETTIDESLRTFANIEPMYEDYVKNNPWMAPGSAKVFSGWGMAANHGGGYSYRLCKIPEEGVSGLTEECFQKTPLKFASDKQWIQEGDDISTKREFLANRTTVGTVPAGSEWT